MSQTTGPTYLGRVAKEGIWRKSLSSKYNLFPTGVSIGQPTLAEHKYTTAAADTFDPSGQTAFSYNPLMDFFQGLDKGAYYHFQASRTPWMDALMTPSRILAGPAGILVLMGIAFFLLIFVQKRRSAVAWLVVIVALSGAAVEGLRWLVRRDRPDVAGLEVSETEFSLSFPSRAVFLATLAVLIVALLLEHACRRPWHYFLLYLIAAALIGYVTFGQLYFSLHYVTDVIAGLIGGFAVALLSRRLLYQSSG